MEAVKRFLTKHSFSAGTSTPKKMGAFLFCNMKKEEWRKIEGYDDYFISNLGNIKSLKVGKVKFLKKAISSSGYYFIKLFYNNSFTRRTIHQLVAVAFLDHIPCGHKLVVDHIDFNRLNNNVNNLRIVTSRENASRKNIKSSSKYVGVSWHKSKNKWTRNYS